MEGVWKETGAFDQKLEEACRYHFRPPGGCHKDKCDCKPSNLRTLMRMNREDGASVEEQPRTRAPLTPMQRAVALRPSLSQLLPTLLLVPLGPPLSKVLKVALGPQTVV